MGEIRIVGPGKTCGYPYLVCKKSESLSSIEEAAFWCCFFFIFLFHSILWASVIQWFRALTLKLWISHHCGSSLSLGTCEMPSSALVGQVVFLWVRQFSPTSD